MKSAFLASALIIVAISHCNVSAQQRFSEDDPECMKIDEAQDSLAPTVDFVENSPAIDGRLDRKLEYLPVRTFNYVRSDAAKPFVVLSAHYRLAYGMGFLYVYVEVQHDKLFCNDRAFQNGDGFQLLIAEPRENGAPTDRYYTIACSAVDRDNQEWTRRITWVHNMHDLFVPLSEDSRLEHSFDGRKISFELLLPWKDIPQFHPVWSDAIGFNLKLVKAVSDERSLYYFVVPDRFLGWAEKRPVYSYLRFDEPVISTGRQQFVQLSRNNVLEGGKLALKVISLADSEFTDTLVIRLKSDKGSSLSGMEYAFGGKPGISRVDLSLDSASVLPPGQYGLTWQSADNSVHGKDAFTVLPAVNLKDLRDRLGELPSGGVSEGSISTLQFNIGSIDDILASLAPYEDAPNTLQNMLRLKGIVDQVFQGNDALADATGPLRRAFRSAIDGTLQPYAVRIPRNFSRNKTYPLIVFLHGSDSDEMDLFGFPFISNGDCIEIGPFGRGKTNWYCTDHAQDDIAEAIADAIANYPIDTGRIILTGFSMGGYGVYRTFYEMPERFAALAVFSGRPYAALDSPDYPDSVYPNFLTARMATTFEDTPLFVFHGEQDKNCPFDVTNRFVDLLRKNRVDVTYVTERDKGHDKPGATSVRRYHSWLASLLQP